jgi:hypothetical protein
MAMGTGSLTKEGARDLRAAWMRDANIRTGKSLVSLATEDQMAALGIKLIRV